MERKSVYWIGLAFCVVAVLGPPSVCSARTVIFTPPSWDTRAASATIKGSEVEYIIESGSQTAPRRYLLSQWNGTDPSPFITVVVWSPATRESVQVSAFGVPGQGAGATVLEFQVGTTRLTEVAASVVQAVNQDASVGLAGLGAAMSTTMLRHDLARMVTDLSTTAFGATTPCVHGLAMLALSSGSAAVPGLEAFSDQWTASARDLIVPNILYQDHHPVEVAVPALWGTTSSASRTRVCTIAVALGRICRLVGATATSPPLSARRVTPCQSTPACLS